jgi:hypothetical protein
MEYEEERGCSGQEEAKDECCPDTSAKGCAYQRYYEYLVILTVDSCGGIVDLTELDLPSTMKTNFPDPADLLNFTLTITPDEGVYAIRWYCHCISDSVSPFGGPSLQGCTRGARSFFPL